MAIVRLIAAVLVGYLVYAAGSMLLVGPVSSGGGAGTVALGAAGLAVIGLLCGLAAAGIAGGRRRAAAFGVGGLILLAAGANLAMQLGAEPLWYKAATMLITAPAAVLVGLRRAR